MWTRHQARISPNLTGYSAYYRPIRVRPTAHATWIWRMSKVSRVIVPIEIGCEITCALVQLDHIFPLAPRPV